MCVGKVEMGIVVFGKSEISQQWGIEEYSRLLAAKFDVGNVCHDLWDDQFEPKK